MKKEEEAYERQNPGSDLKRPSKKVGNPRRKELLCAYERHEEKTDFC